MRKTVLCFGELLWDLLPGGAELGGAPSNFACRMHTLGHEALIVSRVGTDELGGAARRMIAQRGLEVYGIQEDTRHPTGTVAVSVSAKGEPDFHIAADAAYDHLEMTGQVEYAARKADCIYYGTLIQRAPASRRLLQEIFAIGARAARLLDLNLRKDCFSQETVEDSLANANILKLNGEEVERVAGMFGLPRRASEFTRTLMEEYPSMQVCIVTRGANGVFARNSTGETVEAAGIPVQVADTCGSGDAFTAGFMHQFFAGASLQKCCAYGNAFGAAVAETKGGTAAVALERVEQLAGGSPG